jgi:cytochrome P450
LSQPYINKDDVDYVLISGQLLEITFASISTTASAAENFLLDFATKPEYWNDLLEEQEKVNPNNDREINLDQVSKMEKLDSFLKESLRLFGTLRKLIFAAVLFNYNTHTYIYIMLNAKIFYLYSQYTSQSHWARIHIF